jgi:hypothetical protein
LNPEPDLLVDLVRVPHGFEAETIAESLQARGIEARAFTTVGDTMQWEAGIKPSCLVQVPRSQLRAAQLALASLKSDSIDIDWDELFGPEEPAPIRQEESHPMRKRSVVRILGLGLLLGFVLWVLVGVCWMAWYIIARTVQHFGS